jgi:hypothetical protein
MRTSIRASSKYAWIAGSAETCGDSSLIATLCWDSTCSASHTSPRPPEPIFDRITNLPTVSPIMSPPRYHG